MSGPEQVIRVMCMHNGCMRRYDTTRSSFSARANQCPDCRSFKAMELKEPKNT